MDNQSKKSDENITKKALAKFMPVIIRKLLSEGLLDEDKLSDRDYILNIIEQNPNPIDEIGIVILIHDHFLASAREAIDADRLEVAVVLIATAIEQIINTFYRQVLEEKEILTYDEVTEMIRTTNTRAKFGWLLSLVADYEIYDDFRKDIIGLMELRNQIVHFKAIASPMGETPIKQRIQEFGIEKMMDIPDNLSDILNSVLDDIHQASPDYKKAMEAAKLFVK